MTDPRTLPVYLHRNEILDAVSKNQVVIVESPTGSGKTTQIPLILNEAGFASKGVIGITQPRRIATIGVCSYIQEQISGKGLPSSYCGYKMRFYDTTNADTRIKILTDGMLLQELKTDPYLSRYSVIMVDEAHERSLNIDLILGLLKQILQHRDDLRVIVSSATINTSSFARFFSSKDGEPAPIISIKARVYDVQVKYFPIQHAGNVDETAYAVCQIVTQLLKRFRSGGYKDNEDTLVFLPGELAIVTCMNALYAQCDRRHLQIYPLYGRLNKEEQEQVFEETQPENMKVVLATNIAETSLTIDNIKVVIDSGYAKINYYNQKDFTSALVQRPVSKASAEQRKGRAGRTSNGTCYRLYTKEDFASRPRWTQEEILRTDLSEVVLRMVDLGIYDFENFPFITKPDSDALGSGEDTLRLIGAIDEDRHLTKIGEVMVRYPLLPRHSRCIYEAIAKHPEMLMPVFIAVSFLSCKTPFLLPPGEEDLARSAHRAFFDEYGDFLSYQKLYKRYVGIRTKEDKEVFCGNSYLDMQSMDEIVHVVEQLAQITRDIGVPVPDKEPGLTHEELTHRLMLCLGSGLLQYVCMKTKARGSEYRTITANEVFIHPGSAWFRNAPQFLLAGEIVFTTKMYARTVSPLRKEWLEEISPSLSSKIGRIQKDIERRERTPNDDNPRSRKNTERPRTYNLYGLELDVIDIGKKKPKPVVVVPAKDLPRLAYSYRKASRHPKGVYGTILFNGCYVCLGARLQELVGLNGRMDLTESGFVEKPCQDIFTLENLESLIPYLGQLMKLSPMKDRSRLGFIELLANRNSMFLHVNASFTEALNNTAYSLLVAGDEKPECKDFKKAYNRILRMLD